MKIRACGAVLALCLTAASAHAAAPEIPFVKSKLPNGLTVILHEDHTTPIVVVNVSYDVGSANEAPKRTGFAHLFEHLMFMGTKRAPTKAFDAWMEAAGGWNNAWTSEDRTDYYDVGPPTALNLLLWLEADRMRDLGPLMTKEKLDAQRDVVRNERRQNTENTPYGKVELRIPELMFPEGHPYHHPVIGSHEDLEAASVEDVQSFFAEHYHPGNASLVIAGDFDANAAKKEVERLFGPIPARAKAKKPAPAPVVLQKIVRETIEDDVELEKIVMTWHSPAHFAADDAELDLLATALASGKASRLDKTLVREQKLAQSVEARQESGALGSRFTIGVLARPGVNLDKLEAAIDNELGAVRKAALAEDEIVRSRNLIETAFVKHLESIRDRASLLNAYEAERGDPGYAERDLARYRNATKDTVKVAAAKYLVPDRRVILRVVPKKKAAAPKEEKK